MLSQDVDWVFSFNDYQYISWEHCKPTISELTTWSWQKFFTSEKKQSLFSWRGCVSLFQSFSARYFQLYFIVSYINRLFSSSRWNIRYFHALSSHQKKKKKKKSQTLPCPWFTKVIVNHSLDLTNKLFFSHQKDQCCRTFVISMVLIQLFSDLVGRGCRIHQLHLFREVILLQRVSWYDTKQSDGEAPFMLELWVMRSTSQVHSGSKR